LFSLRFRFWQALSDLQEIGAFRQEELFNTWRCHMKLRVLFAAVAFSVLGLTTASSSHAQGLDPCTVYMCMAGISGYGSGGGVGCNSAEEYFFGTLVVYDESGFDAPATAELRRTYLKTCPGTAIPDNAVILNTIIATWYGTP
jgi:hypothetical protein